MNLNKDRQHFLENASLSILRMTKEFKIEYTNSSFVKIFKIERDPNSITGKIFFDIIPSYEQARIRSFYEGISYSEDPYLNYHNGADKKFKINHEIYVEEDGITVFFRKENIKKTFEPDIYTWLKGLPGIGYYQNFDGEKTSIFISPKILELTGYFDFEFNKNGLKLHDLIHVDDKKRVHDHFNTQLKKQKPYYIEYRVQNKFGNLVWVKDCGEIILDVDQRSHISGFWIDITDYKISEIELIEKQNLLETIIESSPSIVFAKDFNLKYLYVNKRWEEKTGYKRDLVIGKKLDELLGFQMADKFYLNDLKAIREERKITVEEIITKEESVNGSKHTQSFISTKFPYRNINNDIIGVCGISTEITAIKEATTMLATREANLHGILQSVNESVLSIDKDLNLVYSNNAFYEEFFKLYGKKLTQGTNIIKQIPDRNQKRKWRNRFDKVIETKEPISLTETFEKNNIVYYFETYIYPIKQNEAITGISIFRKNVSEKKYLEESSKLYSSLFETSINEIILFSIDNFTIIQANNSALRNLGYKNVEIKSLEIANLLKNFCQKLFTKNIQPLIGKKILSLKGEETFKRKNGSTYEAEVQYQLFNYQGNSYISIFSTDITEKKANQKALEESELRFSQVFKENVSPMLLIDPKNGYVQDANLAASKFYGFEIHDFKDKNILDINYTFQMNLDQLKLVTQQVMKYGSGKFEFIHQLNSGDFRDVEVFCSKITYDDKDLVHEIIQDITERNSYQKAIEKQNETLREISWVQSHIIRAPLAKIMGLVHILIEEKDNYDFSSDFILNAVLEAANELDQVIRDITEKANESNVDLKQKETQQ